jgi:hypothetical protein
MDVNKNGVDHPYAYIVMGLKQAQSWLHVPGPLYFSVVMLGGRVFLSFSMAHLPPK